MLLAQRRGVVERAGYVEKGSKGWRKQGRMPGIMKGDGKGRKEFQGGRTECGRVTDIPPGRFR